MPPSAASLDCRRHKNKQNKTISKAKVANESEAVINVCLLSMVGRGLVRISVFAEAVSRVRHTDQVLASQNAPSVDYSYSQLVAVVVPQFTIISTVLSHPQ